MEIPALKSLLSFEFAEMLFQFTKFPIDSSLEEAVNWL